MNTKADVRMSARKQAPRFASREQMGYAYATRALA
jgi:hypothetical protein